MATASRAALALQRTAMGRVAALRAPSLVFASRAITTSATALGPPRTSDRAKPVKAQPTPAWMAPLDTFERRHIGPNAADTAEMLKAIGVKSLEELVDKTLPSAVRSKAVSALPPAVGEQEVLAKMRALGDMNKMFRSFIGQGYYNNHLPSVIKRMILENPGWYTQYTPYQAEISQGRMESLVNYQTMVCDLTGFDMANASLLDEATAGAEAMAMAFSAANKKKTRFLVDRNVHAQTIAVIKTRAEGLGITVEVGDVERFDFSKKDAFGVLFQYPNTNGDINCFADVVARAKAGDALSICATDLLALTLLKAPAEFGCDIAFGSAQRFGVPLGYGGPHAAFLTCKTEYARKLPGRIVGVTRDSAGSVAFRLSLQARETHIRRAKATSNICTAQALLANIAAMYAVYHGPQGLKAIASRVHSLTAALAGALTSSGHTVTNQAYFDTLTVKLRWGRSADDVIADALKRRINLRRVDSRTVSLSLDEATSARDLVDILGSFNGTDRPVDWASDAPSVITGSKFARTSAYLTHPVFNSYHSEMELQRYIKYIENRDLSLTTSMIPLGSCTMKLNAATEMQALTWPEFAGIHPFAPRDQAAGYHKMFAEMEQYLCEVTGYDKFSLQPNSGAQGEYAGLMVIREYQKSIGQGHRDVCLIPLSAHGTNPASAAMAGLECIDVAVTPAGSIDMADLAAKCTEYKDRLSAIMITYPSTYGIFDTDVKELCKIVHDAGGQVYLDGANMNAQVMLCRPGDVGSDVSHLNLHKTFCIPHGGGGPGMGPIGVKAHLAPFLPSHPSLEAASGSPLTVSASPYGSSLIMTISWAYMKMMGKEGLANASKYAILNANYMKARLSKEFNIAYQGAGGMCAHEFIVDVSPFKKVGVEAGDIAKRLMDYGFHAPTLSWPVHDSLMIEPTESESKVELDRFCDALISIRKEIAEIESGTADRKQNVLKNAPHTLTAVVKQWDHPYSREKAVMPQARLARRKFWPGSGRVDDAYGDRNISVKCPPWETYGLG